MYLQEKFTDAHPEDQIDNLNHDPKERVIARLALYGTMQKLSERLLTSRSATFTLEEWCKENGAPFTSVTAIRDIDAEPREPSDDTLEGLGAVADQVSYRKVALCTGGTLLSEADNWYVPANLTEAMNTDLQTTTIPFGKVVAPLKPFRAPLFAEILWKDILPERWQQRSTEDLIQWVGGQQALVYKPNQDLFVHHALLLSERGLPLAEVRETYKSNLLASQITARLA